MNPRTFACGAMFVAAAAVAAAQGTSARILMYHDVAFFDGATAAATGDVFPDGFRDQMDFLERNYNVISLEQFVNWRQGSGSIPANAVVITFDDNYEGEHDFARPVMKELGHVGTNFAHTGYVGVLTSRDHADWNELNIQQSSGVLDVQSHTVNHVNLTTDPNPDFELQQPKASIEANIPGHVCKYIAYPFGGYNATIISKAQTAGYVAGLTTLTGANTSTTPLFELRREGIGVGVTLEDFKIKLAYTGSDTNGPVVLDNANPGFTTTGTWSTLGSASANYGHYGTNYRRASVAASQTATARFTPTLAAKYYDVFAWHASETDPYLNPTGVTYRVRHKTGTATVSVNQRINKAGWHYLGRWEFNAGSAGYVEISNASSTGTYVCADAVKWMPTTSGAPAPNVPSIVDTMSTTGTWSTSTGGFPYGADCKVALGSAGAATATAAWNVTIPQAGWYEVGVWFTTSNASFRSTAAPYTVTHADGTDVVPVNQQDSAGGAKRFKSLGTFRFNSGAQNMLSLSNAIGSATQYVSADAVRVKFVAADSGVAPVEVVVDNTDGGFAASANWSTSTSNPGYYGTNYRVRATASVTDQASWTANLPSAGNWEVYARWTADPNRATAAPYSVVHSGGTTNVNVNQQANNGAWVSLGTYSFASGSSERVRLSCWTGTGSYVVGDAVKLVKR